MHVLVSFAATDGGDFVTTYNLLYMLGAEETV